MDFRKSSKIKAYLKSFNFYNLASFYVIWYLCILGASFHFEKIAIVCSLLLVVLHFLLSKTRKCDALYLVVMTLIGFFADEFFLYFSIIKYPAETLVWNILGVPGWLLMLYVGFSTTMNHSLLFVGKYQYLSAFVGGFGAAVYYYLVSLRGVINFPLGVFSLIIIGIYWALLIGLAKPFQSFISQRFE